MKTYTADKTNKDSIAIQEISGIFDAFGSRMFTRKEYEAFTANSPKFEYDYIYRSHWERNERGFLVPIIDETKHISVSKFPSIDWLVNNSIAYLDTVETFEMTRYGEKFEAKRYYYRLNKETYLSYVRDYLNAKRWEIAELESKLETFRLLERIAND